MPQDRDDREADRPDAARYVYDYATRAQMYATARDAAAAAGRPAPVFNDPKAPWNVLKNTAPATPTADPAADSPDHAARPAGHTSHAGETGYDTPSPTTGGPWEQTWNGTSWVWRAIGAGAGGGAGDGDRRLGSPLGPPTARRVAPRGPRGRGDGAGAGLPFPDGSRAPRPGSLRRGERHSPRRGHAERPPHVRTAIWGE